MTNEEKTVDYAPFCKSKNCPEYIEWSIEGGNLQSCRIVGQSYQVLEFPSNCLHINEIKTFKNHD